MNYIIEYHAQILNGYVVPEKIRKLYIHLFDGILNNPNCNYEYDDVKGDKAITFIESYCRHSKGAFSGQPFLLELWEKNTLQKKQGLIPPKENFSSLYYCLF